MTPILMIRQVTANDFPALLCLLEQLFSIEEDFTFDAGKQTRGLELLLRSENAHIVVAEVSSSVVGMVTGQLLISTAEGEPVLVIEDVVVAPAHQGQGLGSILLRKIADWGLKRGVRRMQLLADKNNNHALTFYTKQQWQKTELICLRKYNKIQY